MLPDWLSNQIRSTINTHLSETCRIERWSDSVGDYGEPVRSLDYATDATCYLTRLNRESDGMVTEAERSETRYMLQLPHDADIRDGDVVIVNDERYQVAQVHRSMSQQVMRQAIVIKVEAHE